MISGQWQIPEAEAGEVLAWVPSDFHVDYRPWSRAELGHLERDVKNVGLMPNFDLFAISGDIVDSGGKAGTTGDAYAKTLLTSLAQGRPDLWALGNHDIRDRDPNPTRAQWELVYGRSANTFVDVKGIRFVTFAPDVDHNVIAGRPGWNPPASTWNWLDGAIASAEGKVVIVTHMPPAELGLADSNSVQPPARYNQLLADHPNVMAIVSGHMHWELADPRAAKFLELGGRLIPVFTDISSMLSINGQSRDQSGQFGSFSPYLTFAEDGSMVRLQYRNHGAHRWDGPDGKLISVFDIDTGTVFRS